MQRERLTITLDSSLLSAIDTLIDKETLRNRSQTIEYLLREGVGLHQLHQGFLFVSSELSTESLIATTRLYANSDISTIFLCLPATLISRSAELSQLITETYAGKEVSVQLVPADFGTGGALLLHRAAITTPIALSFLKPGSLPENLTGAYLFHRSHHAFLTTLLHTQDGSSYQDSGIAIAQPELLSLIPAGIANVEQTVFPQLVKEAKVRAYPFNSPQ
ncbi:MAG: hypothetical protein K0S20_647 [Patescibacteria group bacterium]|nr:hypothetical protein [Patescibacteria group bacterium]